MSVLPSCLTLRHGYIRNTSTIEEKILNGEIQPDSALTRIGKEKQILIEKAASLSLNYSGKFKEKISANQLNSVFDNLKENLAKDSVLYAIARSTPDQTALIRLLESADAYHKYFRQNKHIRRTVNRGNSAAQVPKRILNKSQRFLLTPSVRKSIDRQISIQDIRPASLASVTGFTIYRHGDRINEFGYELLNVLSRFFGNAIGMFNQKPDHNIDSIQLLTTLQPLDIVLLKSKTHLTDKFIPGFFGHAAVYTGDRQFLETSGFWDLPEVIRYRKEITSGKVFAEGLRSGLQLSSVDQFIDGEIFLIMRISNLSESEKARIIRRVYSNIGKKYDFNYDIRSPDKVFCSELIFLAFDQITWLSHKSWGRRTIEPDEIARSIVFNPRLQFTGLIISDKITENPSTEQIFKMMEE